MTQTLHTASPDDIDIMALWRAIMDRKKTLLAVSLGVGALTFFGLTLVTPQYTSTTRLIIENDQSVYDKPTGQQGQGNDVVGLLDKEAVISQVHVLRSHDLASDVIKKLRLNMQPEFNSSLRAGGFLSSIVGGKPGSEEERVLRAFTKQLTVYPIKDSRVIAVDMTSEDPKLAAAAANALAEGYLAWQRGRQANQTKDETASLGRQLEDLKKQVEAADFKLEKFRSETGLYSGQNNTTLNQQQLSEVNSQLSRAKAQRSEAEARARQIREMMANGTVDSAPDVLRSQLIQRLLEQRVQVQRRISELSATLLPKHPTLRQVLAERAGITRQIRSEVRKIVRGIENEARIAGAREASLRKSLDQVREQASKTGNDQVRVTLLEREARSKRTLYDAMLRKFDEASSASSSRNLPVYARIVDKARVTSIPSFPQKLPMSIFATAATLLLGLAWVVTRALLSAARPELAPTPGNGSGPGNGGRRDDSFGNDGLAYGAAGATSAIGQSSSGRANAQGSAPPSTSVAEKNGTSDLAPVAEIVEGATRQAFSSTSALSALLLARGHSKPGFRTLVTTSAQGASALATGLDLARDLAKRGARTIVLSGEPGETFSPLTTDSVGGVTDILTGNVAFLEAVRRDKVSGAHLVDAGSAAFDWSDGRNAERVNRFFDSLDSNYDQVLLATELGKGIEIFTLMEGRFDQGVVCGAMANAAIEDGMFLGYEIPEFHAAALETPRREAQTARRAQFTTPAPTPASL